MGRMLEENKKENSVSLLNYFDLTDFFTFSPPPMSP